MPRLRQLTTAIVASLVFSSAAYAKTDFNNMVVFGDSLSDNGNLSLALGLPSISRFTTNPGKVAVENIASSFGFTLTPSLTGGTDYAFGGAGLVHNSPGTPSSVPLLGQQYTMYLASNNGKANPNTLFSVWGGANDIFYATSPSTGLAASTIPTVTGQAALNELHLLGTMKASGARYVIVFNLPDIGKTPAGLAAGATNSANLTNLTLLFNGTLNTGLQKLSGNGFNIIPVNTFGLVHEVLANPGAYGFQNVTDAACGLTSNSLLCGPAGSGAPYTYPAGAQNTYLFADGVHPTTAAHRMLAQYVVAEINAPSQASLMAEAPIAAANTHLRTVRVNAMQDMNASSSRLFANVTYGKQTFDATANTSQTKSNNVNLTFGTIAHAGDNVTLGLALGVSHNKATVAANQGGFTLDSVQGSGFAYYHVGGGYLGAYLGVAQLNYNNVQRRFQLGAMTRSEYAQVGGNQIMSGLMTGWDFHAGSFTTGPFGRLQWQKIKVDSYSERNGDSSSMWYDAQTRLSLQQTLGWRLRGNWTVGELMMHPYVSLSWNHEDHAKPRKVTAGLTSMNGSFAMTGFIPGKNWTGADIGLMTEFSSTTSGWLGYQGHFGDNSQKLNSLNMGLRISF